MEATLLNQNAERYLQLLERIRATVKDEETVRVVLSEIGKDFRTRMISGERQATLFGDAGESKRVVNGDMEASEKQIGYLKRLGVKVPENCTRLEASQLIDEAKVSA